MVLVYFGALYIGVPHAYALFALILALLATSVSARTVIIERPAVALAPEWDDWDDAPPPKPKQAIVAPAPPVKQTTGRYWALFLGALIIGSAVLALALSLSGHGG
jgi:hypothetical protein